MPAWSWVTPLGVAALVFSGVLVSTPPGFGAIAQVLVFRESGPLGDAAAYALGAAASLAFVALVGVATCCRVLLVAMRHRRADASRL